MSVSFFDAVWQKALLARLKWQLLLGRSAVTAVILLSIALATKADNFQLGDDFRTDTAGSNAPINLTSSDADGKSSIISVTEVANLRESYDVWSLEFSPDGKRLAVSSPVERSVHIWDLASKQIVHSLEKPGPVSPEAMDQLRFSPDGRFLAIDRLQRKQSIMVWDAAAATLIKEFGNVSSSGIAFTPDSQRLVASFERHLRPGSDGKGPEEYMLAVFDTQNWQMIQRMGNPIYFHAARLALSPDGKYAAVGGTYVEPHPERNHLSPDGKMIILGSIPQVQVKIVDLARMEVIRTLIAREAQYDIEMIAWSADGKYIAYGGKTDVSLKDPNAVKIWNAASGELVATDVGEPGPYSLRYTPDGRYFISGGVNRKIKIWDAEQRHLLHEIPGWPGALAVSRDGKYFAGGGDRHVIVWGLQ